MSTSPEPTTQPVAYRIRHRSLERFVRAKLGLKLNFIGCSGHVTGQTVEYVVAKYLPPSLEKLADRVRNGEKVENIPLILNVLCQDGYLPEGLCLVDIRREPPLIERYERILNKERDPLAPTCIEFKNRHRRNERFMHKAKALDQMYTD